MTMTLERECHEALKCPGCGTMDVDFDFLAYRLLRCYACRAAVRITKITAHIGSPEEPWDAVVLEGELAESPGRPSK